MNYLACGSNPRLTDTSFVILDIVATLRVIVGNVAHHRRQRRATLSPCHEPPTS
jgi:hypothetical protein